MKKLSHHLFTKLIYLLASGYITTHNNQDLITQV